MEVRHQTPGPVHINHRLRHAADLVTARCLATAAATRSLLEHDDVDVDHIIVRDDTIFWITSVEGPRAVLDPASREIASTMGAEVVVSATRTGGGDARLEWFDSTGHSETVEVSPFAPHVDRLVDAGVTAIPAAARIGFPGVDSAIWFLLAATRAAVLRGDAVECHLVVPMGDKFGIISLEGPGQDAEDLLIPARAAARASAAVAALWSVKGSVDVEYPGQQQWINPLRPGAEFLDVEPNHAWLVLADNVERIKTGGKDTLSAE